MWLNRLGARVYGYALEAPTSPSLFEAGRISSVLTTDTRSDILDLPRLKSALHDAAPQIIFHLAAQPLVLASYRDPIGTFASNVMGTTNVLEAARLVDSVRAVIVITTDKVYEDSEGAYPHREDHRLGGHDPYSASKAAAEIVAASYRASFFSNAHESLAKVATARAGNVIGGGDWASDRLVPDCVRAFIKGDPVIIRSARAIRPWQHVLEPLAGYLRLAQRLFGSDGAKFAQAWNFGPDTGGDATVAEVAEMAANLWGRDARIVYDASQQTAHETPSLRLDSTLARTQLEWKPVWPLTRALEQTMAWYREWASGVDVATISYDQIRAYEAAAEL